MISGLAALDLTNQQAVASVRHDPCDAAAVERAAHQSQRRLGRDRIAGQHYARPPRGRGLVHAGQMSGRWTAEVLAQLVLGRTPLA